MLKTKYEEIVHVDEIATGKFRHPSEVVTLALRENVWPASGDLQRILLLVIDPQNDFTLPSMREVADGEPYGSLSVPGAKGDIERLTRFTYNNFEKITQFFISLDTHYINQIFNRMMWRDQNGTPISPGTLITPADMLSGKFHFVGDRPDKAFSCATALEKAGKGGILIWPDHTPAGTFGWNVETQLMQMITFHSAVRRINPIIVFKGTDPYSEMYGILEPEYNPDEWIMQDVVDAIADFNSRTGEPQGIKWNKIIFAGEAGSHCLPESVGQIAKFFNWDSEILQHFYILKDCTSPVPGFEKQMQDAFKKFALHGIHIVNSTDLVL